MGHNILGTLPKTLRWQEVVRLLDADTQELGAVASAAALAADARLGQLRNDERIAYCFWLLTRVTYAARSDDFIGALQAQGIDADPGDSALGIMTKIAERVRATTENHVGNGQYVEIAALALREALTETVLREGPSLFSSTAADVQRAFRQYSTPARFSELARRFFSHFMSRTLRGFVDREIASHVGRGALSTNSDAAAFLSALDTHTWQSALIVEDFAGGWFSKRNWETVGDISLDDTQRFMAVAFRKLRAELRSKAS